MDYKEALLKICEELYGKYGFSLDDSLLESDYFEAVGIIDYKDYTNSVKLFFDINKNCVSPSLLMRFFSGADIELGFWITVSKVCKYFDVSAVSNFDDLTNEYKFEFELQLKQDQ